MSKGQRVGQARTEPADRLREVVRSQNVAIAQCRRIERDILAAHGIDRRQDRPTRCG